MKTDQNALSKDKLNLWTLSALSALLLSIPWLVPHTGWLALVGFVPLLVAQDIASAKGIRRFWIWHYSCFVLWNAITTFWVWNATAGGAVFAILANALQMSLVFGAFRLSKKKLGGPLPYIFLVAIWMAWEWWYLQKAEISWPWLVLGNAFARSTHLVQWYSVTGTLGGSLWVLVSNLAIFCLIRSRRRLGWAVASLALVALPIATSLVMYSHYEERSEGSVDVVIAQPNFDPYQKFESMTQAEQNEVLVSQFTSQAVDSSQVLFLGPETFTSDIRTDNPGQSPTLRAFTTFLKTCSPRSTILAGASTYDLYSTRSAPTPLAYEWGDGWLVSHNTALTIDTTGHPEFYHKSKLVVGVELTPYPRIFVPLDKWLSKLMGMRSLMGRCVGQPEVSLLHCCDSVPLGCAVCYESVYGEHCAKYVRKGAKALTVITNDAWWGNTPGYRQHLSYSCLRAIETRRDIARCGNTGISCFIDQKGDILSESQWWERQTLCGSINLNSEQTVFARTGDLVGRVCVLMFLLLAALLLVRLFVPRK